MERHNFVNPATRLTTGGMLDILSLARIHGVNISVSWFEEGDYYVLFVRKGNIAEKVIITDSELDAARNDELAFRHKLRYTIHRVTQEYDFQEKRRKQT